MENLNPRAYNKSIMMDWRPSLYLILQRYDHFLLLFNELDFTGWFCACSIPSRGACRHTWISTFFCTLGEVSKYAVSVKICLNSPRFSKDSLYWKACTPLSCTLHQVLHKDKNGLHDMLSLLTLLVSSNWRITNHIYEHKGIVKYYERKSIVEKEKKNYHEKRKLIIGAN